MKIIELNCKKKELRYSFFGKYVDDLLLWVEEEGV